MEMIQHITEQSVQWRPMTKLFQDAMITMCMCQIVVNNYTHTIGFFSSQKRWEKLLEPPQDVFRNYNCEKFVKHLISYNGYMLISTFQWRNEYGGNKLEDAILHALFNGIVYS